MRKPLTTTLSWMFLTFCFCAVSLNSSSWAQYWGDSYGAIYPGDFVETIASAWVKDGKEVLTTVEAGRRFVALEVQGEWVLVAVPRYRSKEAKGSRCPVCGARDPARGPFTLPLPDGGVLRLSDEEASDDRDAWIRGYIHKSRLVRPDDCGESSVIIRNDYDEPVRVRLVGPQRRELTVPAKSQRAFTNVRAGHYYIIYRFGDEPFANQGAHFNVEASAVRYSTIVITLRTKEQLDPESRYISNVVPLSEFESSGRR